MAKIRVALTPIITVFLITILIIGTGCAKYAGQDDLQRLEEAKKASVSAEKTLNNLKGERQELENKLKDMQQEFAKVEKDLEVAKNK